MKKIQNKGLSLDFASAELKNNKELVIEAVKKDGKSLRGASK